MVVTTVLQKKHALLNPHRWVGISSRSTKKIPSRNAPQAVRKINSRLSWFKEALFSANKRKCQQMIATTEARGLVY